MKIIKVIFFAAALLGVKPLIAQSVVKPPAAQNNFEKEYQDAIKNSMYPPGDTKDTSLIAIVPGNKNLVWKTIKGEQYVLMVTWAATNYYGDSGVYNTGNYQIWTTTAPELQQRMKKEKYSDPELRLTQLLGLPPGSSHSMFIEFWVRPQDLFRPCPDKEINDKTCNLCFGAKDSLDPSYIQWINNTRISRYYACGLYNQYPWTELGYTYDWNAQNKNHVGLCEFVIGENKNIYVNKVYNTKEYLK